MPRTPRSSKSPEQLRRTGRGEPWTVLPTRCTLTPPPWPTPVLGRPSAQEKALWASLWRGPLGNLWHSWVISPMVIARYVRLFFVATAHSTTARLESDLGLTPAALLRLRLLVEDREAELTPLPRRGMYDHIKLVDE